MKIRFVIAIAAAAISWALPAAGAPEEYRVRALSLLPTPPAEVHLHDAGGKGTAGVVHPKSFLNHEYELLKTKGGAVVLTTKADPGSVKVDGDVVGECELPAKAGSYILLMLPEDGSETKSKVVVVDSSAKAFPPGSFKVINTTTVPVKIELEGKSFEFAAGETKLIEKAPMGENQTAGMKASFERDGKWTTISSGVWPAPGDKRVLQILIESGANKRIELRGIRDVAKP